MLKIGQIPGLYLAPLVTLYRLIGVTECLCWSRFHLHTSPAGCAPMCCVFFSPVYMCLILDSALIFPSTSLLEPLDRCSFFSTMTSFLHLSSCHSTFFSACLSYPRITTHVALFNCASFICVCPQSPLSFCKVSSFVASMCSPFCLHHTFLQFFSFISFLYFLFPFFSIVLCMCSGCP